MTNPGDTAGIAALLDAITFVQGQLEELAASGRRTEATQAAILARLDALADRSELAEATHDIATRMAADRKATRAELTLVAQIAGLAHAAATGSAAPLPANLLDDELLERYLTTQPADHHSSERALREWRRIASETAAADLQAILARQYQPSATDTTEARLLRYRLAAITREELQGRGASLPPTPASTFPSDRSSAARAARSAELAASWRVGLPATVHAEPELAGALDIVAEAERQSAALSPESAAAALAELKQSIFDHLVRGERPVLAEATPTRADPERLDAGPTSRHRE